MAALLRRVAAWQAKALREARQLCCWRDILTHAGHQGRALALSELLARWPVALCRVQS
ncbi:alpha amylase [Bordetella pertussis]|nr:alpha amylase [Bordetella pertussis]